MELWRYGAMAVWSYGSMELWRYGGMELWSGIMRETVVITAGVQKQHLYDLKPWWDGSVARVLLYMGYQNGVASALTMGYLDS